MTLLDLGLGSMRLAVRPSYKRLDLMATGTLVDRSRVKLPGTLLTVTRARFGYNRLWT